MKLYKYYKPDCSPCQTLAKIMNIVGIPEDIEVVELSVAIPENKKFLDDKDIHVVPVLVFENGNMLIGVKKKEIVKEFINSKGENLNAIPN